MILLLYSKTVPDHFAKPQLVLINFADADLELKLSKCHFIHRETIFLGHMINSSGIHTSTDKIETVTYPYPTNVDQVRIFLGLRPRIHKNL